MANKKFDQKTYQNRERIMIGVPGTMGIARAWVWNKEKNNYVPPPQGKTFEAFRYDPTPSGGKKRTHKSFETLDEAREWQNGFDRNNAQIDAESPAEIAINVETNKKQITLAEVITDYRNKRYASHAIGTRVHYDQLLRLHFSMLMPLPINNITARVIDEWITSLKQNIGRHRQAKLRKSFDKELTLLKVILRYYDEYYEDPIFRFPVKKRHSIDAVVIRNTGEQERDLPYEDFLKVRNTAQLIKGQGRLLSALITVQYRQALRISEACALHWEDIRFNLKNPELSIIRVSRHVEWSRCKGIDSLISLGFKNSRSAGGVKEQPMFPETYEALRSLYYVGARGLIFKNQLNEFFTYRQIQHFYSEVFGKAGVVFRGTHSLRHGGCRAVYNETGDLALAGQLLGNEDSDTVKVYARRDKAALKKLTSKHWANWTENQQLHEIARTQG